MGLDWFREIARKQEEETALYGGRLIPAWVSEEFLRLNALWEESPETFEDKELRDRFRAMAQAVGVDLSTLPEGLREEALANAPA